MYIQFFILLLLPLPSLQSGTLYDFPNTLDLHGIPSTSGDTQPYIFSDQGAWHAFGLPPLTSSNLIGCFIGPLIHGTNQGWTDPCLVQLQVFSNSKDPSQGLQGNFVRSVSFPGLLQQEYTTGSVSVELQLVFGSSRTSLIVVKVTNTLSTPQTVSLGFSGSSSLMKGTFEASTDTSLSLIFSGKTQFFDLTFPQFNYSTHINPNKQSYQLVSSDKITLPPSASFTTSYAISFFFDKTELLTHSESTHSARSMMTDPLSVLNDTVARWNGYLDAVLTDDMTPQKKFLAVKCIQTLMTNWRSPALQLLHSALFPSYISYEAFWAWDSWKHAYALSLFAPQIGQNQIEALFDFQNALPGNIYHGMVPDVISHDGSNFNFANTKPPLASWATWQLFSTTNDTTFLELIFPKLFSYHRWWDFFRDHNDDGFIEYGCNQFDTCTQDDHPAAKWESGMDNAVRFDNVQLLEVAPLAFTMDRSSVDLNSYYYSEKIYLSLIADTLGLPELAKMIRQEALDLEYKIQTDLFDPSTGYFYDRYFNGTLVNIQGCEGWIPLSFGIATTAQASEAIKVILNPTKFALHIPFPTVSAKATQFDPTGYWRGPVWMDQAYFALKGLNTYGYTNEASTLFNQFLSNVPSFQLNNTAPLHEYYNPITGEALGAPHFGWTAAHLLLMITEKY